MRKSIKAKLKQNPATTAKAWITRSHGELQKPCYIDDPRKLTNSLTFPCDLNFILVVNHDNPVSTKGARAKAL